MMNSAYKLACSIRKELSPCAEFSHAREDKRRMWKKVQILPVKPKLKHFLWRCIHNWLATGSAVRKGRMEVDDTCRRCGFEKKIREQLSFHCPESSLIWKVAPISQEGIHRLIDSFEEWWMTICLTKHDPNFQKRMEITVYLLWNIWKPRCA